MQTAVAISNNLNNLNNLKNLNDKQREAASIIEGPVLVLAGAGSGKTSVVTKRIVHLIDSGIDATSILGVTFTNKAAQEMKERIGKMTNHHVLICTFHSLGVKVLRQSIEALGYQSNFIIYDEDDATKVLKACLVELGLEIKKADVKPYRQLISSAKNALKSPDELDMTDLKSEIEQAFPKVYRLYQSKLQQYNAIDFDDLLYLTVRLWQQHPEILASYQNRWPFVLIDEYQDTNHAQYLMTRMLVEKSRNLFVVGDPDQSIYSWRGANVNNILNFEKDYPGAKVIRLEQNYRSTSNILDTANALISYNTGRYEKNLWSDLGAGEKIKLFIGEGEREEADFVTSQVRYHQQQQQVPLSDMVVFYRTNAQSRAFEDLMLYRGIPYVIVGGLSFYQRREIKDIMAFLRLALYPADFIAFQRTINLPKRGFGESTIDKIRMNAEGENMPIFVYCDALVHDQPLENPTKLSAKQKEGLKEYVRVIHEIQNANAADEVKVKDVVIAAIEKSRYLQHLKEDAETFAERKENLDELIAKAVEWEVFSVETSLEAFLEELSLKSSLDEANTTEVKLSLMTIHNGKGLEFKITFLVGLEEDLFPHINTKDNPAGVEEERRLCYVGITRAREQLYLSFCRTRYLWGTLRAQRPSRFLRELPSEYLEKIKRAQTSSARLSRFGSDEREELRGRDEKPVEISGRSEQSEESAELVAGDKVFHKEFGIGLIKEVSTGALGLTYKICFTKDNSTKNIVAKYAVLKKL